MPEFDRIRILLFDMGGVLVSIHPRRVFRYWSQASGVHFDEFVGRWAMGQHYKDYETGKISFNQLASGLSDQLGIEMSLDDWRRGWNALVGKPYRDVFQLVQKRAPCLPVYCFTNSNPEHESVWATDFDRELSIFRAIFNSSTIGLRKPDVEAFLHTANSMEVNPRQVLFLDDNHENVQGATRSGMQAVHVPKKTDTLRVLRSLLSHYDKDPD